jgi:5-methylcytosine-specific restriction endonuclease McrA
VSLAEMLTELAGDGSMRDIEHELALAQRASSHTHRGHINWARHFPWLRQRLGNLQNHRCCWCGKRMTDDGPRDHRPTFEHIVPLSKGGADSPTNLAIACYGCNWRRGDVELSPAQVRPSRSILRQVKPTGAAGSASPS